MTKRILNLGAEEVGHLEASGGHVQEAADRVASKRGR
jgi:hypothetical protein